MAKITLKEVAKREGVSIRTVNKWVKSGKPHGLDVRDAEHCSKIKAMLGHETPAPAEGRRERGFELAEHGEGGDLVKQLQNARRLTQGAFEALEKEKGDGARQDRLRTAYDKALALQIKLEKSVREILADRMLPIDDVRGAMRSAFAQIRAKLEAGGNVLLVRLEGLELDAMAAEYEEWVERTIEEVRGDAERRVASV